MESRRLRIQRTAAAKALLKAFNLASRKRLALEVVGLADLAVVTERKPAGY